MDGVKTQSIRNIEEKLEDMQPDTMRHYVLTRAKDFKTSWIELGRALYAIWNDRLYRDWGFNTFEGYTAKEIGIRKNTALKLVRSYMFLEKEESWCLDQDKQADMPASQVPSYEAVNVLRQAKDNKNIEPADYDTLKSSVFEGGKDHLEVKKDLTAMIKRREELDPEEERTERRRKVVRRFISSLKSAKTEMSSLKLLPKTLIEQAEDLINKIEACIE